jgi:hypothetical protein
MGSRGGLDGLRQHIVCCGTPSHRRRHMLSEEKVRIIHCYPIRHTNTFTRYLLLFTRIRLREYVYENTLLSNTSYKYKYCYKCSNLNPSEYVFFGKQKVLFFL